MHGFDHCTPRCGSGQLQEVAICCFDIWNALKCVEHWKLNPRLLSTEAVMRSLHSLKKPCLSQLFQQSQQCCQVAPVTKPENSRWQHVSVWSLTNCCCEHYIKTYQYSTQDINTFIVVVSLNCRKNCFIFQTFSRISQDLPVSPPKPWKTRLFSLELQQADGELLKTLEADLGDSLEKQESHLLVVLGGESLILVDWPLNHRWRHWSLVNE